MKIDFEYIKDLLEAFESSETTYTDINKLKNAGFEWDENLLHHMKILSDYPLVVNCNDEPYKCAFIDSMGAPTWQVTPIRLTRDGYDFLDALKNNTVLNKIKTELKGLSIGTIVDASKALLLNAIT